MLAVRGTSTESSEYYVSPEERFNTEAPSYRTRQGIHHSLHPCPLITTSLSLNRKVARGNIWATLSPNPTDLEPSNSQPEKECSLAPEPDRLRALKPLNPQPVLLEILNRVPTTEVLRPFAPNLLQLCMHLLDNDDEENAVIALRIILDLHKTYRAQRPQPVGTNPEPLIFNHIQRKL
jgi:hypothetical protein